MCYQPVKIKNPKLKSDISQFDKMNDTLYLNVPCGRCGQCISSKHDGNILRVLYEYRSTINQGGFVFWNTFTYSEDNVPCWHGLKTFDHDHYRKFSMRIREHLSRNGYDSKDHLKIFWVSEYGENYSRPHYHALFFITFPITPDEFNQFLHKCWPYGRLDDDKPSSALVVDSENSYVFSCRKHKEVVGLISYVSKYVNKSCDLMQVVNSQKGSKFSDWFKLEYENRLSQPYPKVNRWYDGRTICVDAPIDYDMLDLVLTSDECARLLPYHRRSSHFGENIVHDVDIEQIKSSHIRIDDHDKVDKFVKTPIYIDRKLFYTEQRYKRVPKSDKYPNGYVFQYNDDGSVNQDYYELKGYCSSRFVLNDLGKEVKVLRSKDNQRYVESNVTLIFDNWSSGLHADLLSVYHKFHAAFGLEFQSVSDVNNFIHSLFNGRSYSQLAEYMSLYMDRVEYDEFSPRRRSHDSFEYVADRIFNPEFSSCDKFRVTRDDLHRPSSYDGQRTYNVNPCFKDFDKLVLAFNILSFVVGNTKQRAYLYQQHLKRNARKYESIYTHKL